MNEERDPIGEWTKSIKKRLFELIVGILVLIVLMGLFAPAFGVYIRFSLVRNYAMYDNSEELIDNAMRPVWISLWLWAIFLWIMVFVAFFHGPLTQ
jgi:uncharacterized membrane protein